MIRAFLLACLLATPCFAQTVTFTLLGGYRIPANVVEGNNTRYAGGCWDLRGGNWIAKHGTGGGISEYTEPETMGDAEDDYESWPQLVATGRYAEPFSTVDDIGPYGVKYLDDDTILCSGRKSYRSGFEANWLCTYNLETDAETLYDMEVVALDDDDNFSLHQRYASGFCNIPQAFADAYCDGNTIGAGRGGYDVLGSPAGPALAALDLAADPADRLQPIVNHPTWSTGAPRSGDYLFPDDPNDHAQLAGWPDADGPGAMEGHWIGGDCGNPAWVPGIGLMFPTKQCGGTMDYRAQGDDGSLLYFGVADCSLFYSEDGNGNRNGHQQETQFQGLPDAYLIRRVYIYSEDELAEVAQGTRDAWTCTPQVVDFPRGPFDWGETRTDATLVQGFYWDAGRSILWVNISQVWNNNTFGVLAAYRVSNGRPQRLTLRSGSTLTLEVAE